MCKVKKPKQQITPAAPAPPEESADVKQADPINDTTSADEVKRRGRNALRIPLSSGGLNIPVG